VLAVGAAIFAAPAHAAVVAPSGSKAMTTFPMSNIAIAEGLNPGTHYDVLVRRNGTIIGQALDQVAPASGALEINHGPDRCWDDLTPDIVAGDVIEFVTAGSSNGIGMTVADISINEPTRGADVVATGRSTAPRAGLLVRLVKGTGASHLEAPGDPKTSITWDAVDTAAYTATFTAPAVPGADIEARIVDGAAVTTAEITGSQACPEPVAVNAMTKLSRRIVNIANQSSPITASGVVQDGITVKVAVSGGPEYDAVVAPDRTWTATIPAADLADLPEGGSQLTATFAGTGAPPAQSRAITKDTIAPAAPVANPEPGTYSTAQSVWLTSPDATVRWTNGAGAPSLDANVPIMVTASQTLRAVAVDAAGNENTDGPVPFAYTITRPQSADAGASNGTGAIAGGGAVSAIVGDTEAGTAATSPVAGGSSAAPSSLQSLLVAKLIKRSKVRTQGVRLTMRLAASTNVLRIRVYRKRSNGTRLLLASGTRAPRAAGLYRTVLKDPRLRKLLTAGNYEVEVAPGTSQSALAAPSRAAFKVT
jgi:hypothetical protein